MPTFPLEFVKVTTEPWMEDPSWLTIYAGGDGGSAGGGSGGGGTGGGGSGGASGGTGGTGATGGTSASAFCDTGPCFCAPCAGGCFGCLDSQFCVA
jgi:hypothetical protein